MHTLQLYFSNRFIRLPQIGLEYRTYRVSSVGASFTRDKRPRPGEDFYLTRYSLV